MTILHKHVLKYLVLSKFIIIAYKFNGDPQPLDIIISLGEQLMRRYFKVKVWEIKTGNMTCIYYTYTGGIVVEIQCT